MMYSVGDRVYWRSMHDVLHSGEILEINAKQVTRGLIPGGPSFVRPYLVRPDGEDGAPMHYAIWMDAYGFVRLPETIETSVD